MPGLGRTMQRDERLRRLASRGSTREGSRHGPSAAPAASVPASKSGGQPASVALVTGDGNAAVRAQAEIAQAFRARSSAARSGALLPEGVDLRDLPVLLDVLAEAPIGPPRPLAGRQAGDTHGHEPVAGPSGAGVGPHSRGANDQSGSRSRLLKMRAAGLFKER